MSFFRTPRQVIVAGAGPVGMTLAAELGQRSIDVLIVDPSPTTTANPRCNTTNARSMEYFRRLGVADEIRRAGLPLDHPTDVVYMTDLTGHELMRFPFSSAQEIFDGTAFEFEEWPTPEPQHRVSQIYLEPIIEKRLLEFPSVELRRGWEVIAVSQNEDVATATLRKVDTGEEETVTAQYVLGCDGGSSVVRKSIGARLEGDATAAEERLSVYFRSPELRDILGPQAGWMYWWYGDVHRGSFLQLDGEELFLLHGRVPEGVNPEELDPDEVMLAAIGRTVEHEKIQVIRWTPRRLVSNKFVDGRVALAGDAAHLWLPLGGFGMNTGIADAVALAWRVASLVKGIGDPELLNDYQIERTSVGEATSQAALRIDRDMKSIGRDPVLHEESAAGDALRAEAGTAIATIDRKQWYSQGVQFGSRYSASPGIVGGNEAASSAIATIDEYVPSTIAGGRMPHIWLPGHVSLFDRLGLDWSLVAVDASAADIRAFTDAASAEGVDLTVVEVDSVDADVLDRALILVRPDLFIAWSGDAAPADTAGAIRSLLGHRSQV